LRSNPGFLEVPGQQDANAGRADPRSNHESTMQMNLGNRIKFVLMTMQTKNKFEKLPKFWKHPG